VSGVSGKTTSGGSSNTISSGDKKMGGVDDVSLDVESGSGKGGQGNKQNMV
jgi:hypothetical protein